MAEARANPEIGRGRRFVPAAELDRDELADLSRDQFLDWEWQELDDELKASIYDNEPSASRMADLQQIVENAIAFLDSDEYWEHEAKVQFDGEDTETFRSRAEQYDVSRFTERGHDEPALRKRVAEILENDDAWGPYAPGGGWTECDWQSEDTDSHEVWVNYDDAYQFIWREKMPDDEVRHVVAAVQEVFDAFEIDADLVLRGDVQYAYVTTQPYHRSIDRDYVNEELEEEFAGLAGEQLKELRRTGRPYEQRVVASLPGGVHVVELDTYAELEEEGGALDHCVHEAEHDWPQAFAGGDVRLFSMRPPDWSSLGKRRRKSQPWFTIAADLTRGGQPVFDQVNGYNNRPVGFPSHHNDKSLYDDAKFRPWECALLVWASVAILATTEIRDTGWLGVSLPAYKRWAASKGRNADSAAIITQYGYPITRLESDIRRAITGGQRDNPRERVLPHRCNGVGFCARRHAL